MPDLLLEFLSEEIPARMQARAADDLKKMVTDRLVAAGLVYEGAKAFATPRRLALSVHGVPVRQPDIKEEKKGPRVGAPENAIAGFLKAAGLKSISEAKVQPDKKGDFYVALIEKAGKPALDVLAEMIPEVVRAFPWPKSMRWGAGRLTWVRPLHSILATFGPETEEPDVVRFDVDGIAAGDETRGHRFMAPAKFKVRRFDDYQAKLEAAKVVLDPARRAEMILADAKNLAFAQGLELVEDDGLLAEVAGLVEWPVTLMGAFDAAFLAIPEEVIRATIRNNQKCFVLRDAQTAKLTNKFILVANEEAADGGKAIVAGNERVIRARLSDAKFFYDTDLKTRLEDRLPKFEHIVFHEKLGSQAERIARIVSLAGELAPIVGADADLAVRAAQLCKADLLTDVVGEFPELQGLMGRYYAEAQGEDEAVAHAIEDHYRPKGPDDLVPADPVVDRGRARRQDRHAGRLLGDRRKADRQQGPLRAAARGARHHPHRHRKRIAAAAAHAAVAALRRGSPRRKSGGSHRAAASAARANLEFKRDRYRTGHEARSPGVGEGEATGRPGLVAGPFLSQTDARFAGILRRPPQGDAARARRAARSGRRRVRARRPGRSADGRAPRRSARQIPRHATTARTCSPASSARPTFCASRRRRTTKAYAGAPDAKRLAAPEEKALAEAINIAKKEATAAVAKEDFAAAMSAMAKLRPKVDAFFDKVTVNVEDKALRENRLKLLNEIREATRAVADFSRIEG